MSSLIRISICFLLALLPASPAVAYIHGQVLVGGSQGNFDGGAGLSGAYTGGAMELSAQFDYFGDLPVTMGAYVTTGNFRLQNTGSAINRLDFWRIGPEIMATYPRFIWQPYLKTSLGYGAVTAREAGQSDEYKSQAWFASFSRNVSLGVKWEKDPSLTPILEVQVSSDELESEDSSADLAPRDYYKFQYTSIRLGIEASF